MPDISKIVLPSGNEYNIKDAVARQLISGGVSFNIVWTQADYASSTTPTAAKLATIPAGAVVAYNSGAGTATGTLVADGDPESPTYTPGFYLIYSKTQAGTLDTFDEFVTITYPTTPETYGWERIGDTQIDLSNVVTGVSLDKVKAKVTGLMTPTTDTVIGSDATFTITQPTIALATDSSSGTGKVQVATGISSVTQPSIGLTANASTATGRITYVESVTSGSTSPEKTHLSATASGGAVSASGDSVTALTGLGSPSTKNAIGASSTFTITQPTITLASNSSTATGRVEVATGGSSTSSTDTDWLKGVSVSNETLTIGAATLSKTYLGATASGANTAWNSKDQVAAVTGYASTTTDTVLGTASTFSVTNPSVTINSGATGDVEVVTDVDDITITPTTKYLSASASGTAVTPTTTYIKGTASGANTAWNSKDTVTVLTGLGEPAAVEVLDYTTSLTVTKGNA